MWTISINILLPSDFDKLLYHFKQKCVKFLCNRQVLAFNFNSWQIFAVHFAEKLHVVLHFNFHLYLLFFFYIFV